MQRESENLAASEEIKEKLLPPATPSHDSPFEDIPSVLEALKRQEIPTLCLPSSIQKSACGSAGIMCGEEVIVGLKDHSLLAASFFPAPYIVPFVPIEAQHQGKITCLKSSPDGKLCISASRDSTLKVWSVSERRELATLKGHTNWVRWAAVTPDSKQCVSVSADGSIKLWSLETFQETATDQIKALKVEVTPNGKFCLCATAEKSILLWGLDDKKTIAMLPTNSSSISRIAITKDSKYCFSGLWNGCVKKWSIEPLREVASSQKQKELIMDLVISPDNTLCISASWDSTLEVWDVEELRDLGTLKGHISSVRAVAVTSDSHFCVSTSFDHCVKVWSLFDLCEVASFNKHALSGLFVLSADGRNFISGSKDNTLKLWSLARKNNEPVIGHKDLISDLTATSKFVVSGSRDSTVQVWSRNSEKVVATFAGHSNVVDSVRVTPDEKYCISGSHTSSSNLKLWSLESMQEVADLAGHTKIVSFIVVTKDSKLCISSSADSSLRVWDIEARKEIATLTGHTACINCLVVVPDNKRIVSCSDDTTIKLWSLVTLKLEATLEGHSADVYQIAVTSDSKFLCSGGIDKLVKVWSLEDLHEIASFPGHSEAIRCLRITPDNKHCITGSEDRLIKVWSLQQRRLVAILGGHTGVIMSLDISSDGKFCLSCDSGEGSVILWSLKHFRRLAILAKLMVGIRRVAFTPDSRYYVYGTFAGRVCLYPLSQFRGDSGSGPTPIEFTANIQSLEVGAPISKHAAMLSVPSHGFNSLHISAYFSHSKRLQQYFTFGVPLIRGAFGSPLTVALSHNDIKCADVILKHLIDLVSSTKGDEEWPTFATINDDIVDLLSSGASLLVPFFEVLMQRPAHEIEQFIRPMSPMRRHFETRFVDSLPFDDLDSQEEKVLIVFYISLFSMNSTPGSESSIKFLTALAECEDKSVLKTPLVAAIIEEKWEYYYSVTLGLTLAYALLLFVLVLAVYIRGNDSWIQNYLFSALLGLNGFFLLYEVAQIFVLTCLYFADPWNYVDLLRGTLCLMWIVCQWRATNEYRASDFSQLFTLSVVGLCFLRGFTYFRSFKMTRVFVYMTIEVVKDIFSFLIILAYSAFSFGIFSVVAELSESVSLIEAWNSAFNFVIGESESSIFSRVKWFISIGSGIIITVIMMNLLVSILGEAYTRTKESITECDLREQLKLLLEYEHLLFWRRSNGRPSVLVTCVEAKDIVESEEWSEKVLKIASLTQKNIKALEEEMQSVEVKMNARSAEAHKKIVGIQEKIEEARERIGSIEAKAGIIQEKTGAIEAKTGETQEKIRRVEDKIEGIEKKIEGVGEKIEGMKVKVEGIEEKIGGVEKKIEAILSLLQIRS